MPRCGCCKAEPKVWRGIIAFSCGCMDEKVCFTCNRCQVHCMCGFAGEMHDPWPVVLGDTLLYYAAIGVRL